MEWRQWQRHMPIESKMHSVKILTTLRSVIQDSHTSKLSRQSRDNSIRRRMQSKLEPARLTLTLLSTQKTYAPSTGYVIPHCVTVTSMTIMMLSKPTRPGHCRRRMRRLWMGRTTQISDHHNNDHNHRYCCHSRRDGPITIRSRCRLNETILVGLLLLVSLFHEPPRILGFTTITTTTTTATATTKITEHTNVPLFSPSLQRRPSLVHQQRHYHFSGFQNGVRPLRSSSTSDDDEEAEESWSSPEYRYAQRLQQQIDLLRQKDRSSRPIAVSDLQIIYEDHDIIVVDKPAGILCLPSEEGVPSIVETVFAHIQQQQQQQQVESITSSNEAATNDTAISTHDTATNTTTPISKNIDYNSITSERVQSMDQMIVHRLGYDTAGLLILAKTIPAVRALNILFRTRPAIPALPPLVPVTNTNIEIENSSNPTTESGNDAQDNKTQSDIEMDSDDSMVDEVRIAERLNQMGIIRQYEVLVAGHVRPLIKPTAGATTGKATESMTHQALGCGWIHLPLMRCYEYPPYMRVSTPEQQQYLLSLDPTIVGKKLLEAPKPSSTYYEVMNYEYMDHPNTTLPVTRMTLTSMTGRTHQLNVHCAAIGHPIVRDTVYGYNGSAAPLGGLSPDQLPKGRASIELQRAIHEVSTNHDNNTTKMCVHAKVIRFKHPMTGADLEFTSPPSF